MKMQNIDQYLAETHKTALYPKWAAEVNVNAEGLTYPTLKLNGEAGEFAELVGKAIRDDNGRISDKRRAKMALELGDIAWYWTRLCFHLGFLPSEILSMNVDKLEKRARENKIHGEGSGR